MNLASHSLDLPGDDVPKLSGAEFRIHELLDQRRFDLFLPNIFLAGKEFLEPMRDRLGDGETLDPLCAPFRADLVAGNAPHLLRVGLEECLVELAPEAADKELLQVIDCFGRKQRDPQITEPDLYDTDEAKITQRLKIQLDGVRKKLSQEIYPRT